MTDVMCDFSAGLKCPRCGYEAPEQRTFRVCRTLDEMAAHVAQVTAKPWISVPNPMLGDRLAHALALVGVTKQRVSKAVGGDCGCQQRQTGLNRLGGVVAKSIETVLDNAVSAFIGSKEDDKRVAVIRQQLIADEGVNSGIKRSHAAQ